jgi:hypothetical protein
MRDEEGESMDHRFLRENKGRRERERVLEPAQGRSFLSKDRDTPSLDRSSSPFSPLLLRRTSALALLCFVILGSGKQDLNKYEENGEERRRAFSELNYIKERQERQLLL